MTPLQVEQNERNVDQAATQLRFYMNAERKPCTSTAQTRCRAERKVHCVYCISNTYLHICMVSFTVRMMWHAALTAGQPESVRKTYPNNTTSTARYKGCLASRRA